MRWIITRILQYITRIIIITDLLYSWITLHLWLLLIKLLYSTLLLYCPIRKVIATHYLLWHEVIIQCYRQGPRHIYVRPVSHIVTSLKTFEDIILVIIRVSLQLHLVILIKLHEELIYIPLLLKYYLLLVTFDQILFQLLFLIFTFLLIIIFLFLSLHLQKYFLHIHTQVLIHVYTFFS